MTDKIGPKTIKQNPALKPLEVLVGEWQTTGSHPYFADTVLHGRASFEWIEGGAFLLMRSEIDHPKFPDGIVIFCSDDQEGTFYMMLFDERDISRKYDLSINGNELEWRRDDPEFSQRFKLTINEDTLVGEGEMSRSGGTWEKDLSLTYKRE